MRVRQALRGDLADIAELWIDAFAADPYLRWIQPDDARWPAFGRAWFDFILGLTFERGHTYVADPVDVAVAWVPPDLALVGPGDIERGAAILAEHGGAERSEQALAMILEARGHALEVPHWTLQYIGVRSSRTGSGLGRLAVEPCLAECDNDGLPCGLVSTNPRNVPFYNRLGFEIDAEVRGPDPVVSLRPMSRAPASA